MIYYILPIGFDYIIIKNNNEIILLLISNQYLLKNVTVGAVTN